MVDLSLFDAKCREDGEAWKYFVSYEVATCSCTATTI